MTRFSPRTVFSSTYGLVVKRLDSPYPAGGSLRGVGENPVRCTADVVIVGWWPASCPGGTHSVGGLLVAGHDAAGQLVAVGHVGTGFSTAMRRRLFEVLVRVERKTAPLRGAEQWSGVRWVRPKLVGEVAYREYVPGQGFRHASWKGLRELDAGCVLSDTETRLLRQIPMADQGSGQARCGRLDRRMTWGSGDQSPVGSGALARCSISRRTGICAARAAFSHECCWAQAWTSAVATKRSRRRRDIRLCQSEWGRSSSVCWLHRQPYHSAVTLAAIWSAIFNAESAGLALHVLMSIMTLFLSASARPQPQPGAPALC
jgi:hypothetical protein